MAFFPFHTVEFVPIEFNGSIEESSHIRRCAMVGRLLISSTSFIGTPNI